MKIFVKWKIRPEELKRIGESLKTSPIISIEIEKNVELMLEAKQT